MDKMNAKQISFGGMVFMYGNMQIIADNGNGKVVLSKYAGADGFSEKVEEKNVDIEIFDKLVDAIDTIGFSVAVSEEDNTFVVIEEEEETGAYEWYVAVTDKEDNILFCLRGNNPESEAFNVVNKSLEDICSDFGCVDAFFQGVNE